MGTEYLLLAAGWTREEQVLVVFDDGVFLGYGLFDPSGRGQLFGLRATEPETIFGANGLAFHVPATGEDVAVFGELGGDGVHRTRDRWQVQVVFPRWPDAGVLLYGPESVRDGPAYQNATLLDVDGRGAGNRWLKCGFSPSGHHLLIVSVWGAIVFTRWTP